MTPSFEACMTAIVLNPRFPAPDRSKQSVRRHKDSDGVLDLGWCEGILYDGRPFRAETWAQDDTTMVTIFFSTVGIEDVAEADLIRVMELEEVVAFKEGGRARQHPCRKIQDGAGNSMWSVNITVGVDDDTYVAKIVPYFRYAADGEPPTFFRQLPSSAG
jgi:hypothetical protein